MCKRTIFADSTEGFHIFLAELELEFFIPCTFPADPVCRRHEKEVKPFNLTFL
jgi:hypothetical protein